MQRIQALDPANTSGKSKDLFDIIQKKLGIVPNMMRTMGTSPAVLNAYLSFSKALDESSIGSALGEQIALAVANSNGCNYCNAAHSFIGEKLLHMDTETITLAREGKAKDEKSEAALKFAQTLISKKGIITDGDFNALRKSGFSEAAIAEIIAFTALNIFTNYFNNVAHVIVDFPEVTLVEKVAA